MTETLEFLRAANVALAVLAVACSVVRINYLWDTFDRGRKLWIVGGGLFPVVAAYGSIEAHAQNAPVGLRTLLVTLACVLTLAGLAIARRDDH